MSALFALAAAIGWGSSDFAAGHASRKSSAVSVVILTHFAALIALICFAVDFGPVWTTVGDIVGSVGPGDNGGPIRWSGPGISGAPTSGDLAWGIAAGLGGGLGAMLLFSGLGKGSMAVVAPITATGAAAIPVMFGILTGDSITVFGIVGIALAFVAIVLVSLTGADPDDPDLSEELTVPDDWSAQFRLPAPSGPAVLPPPNPALPGNSALMTPTPAPTPPAPPLPPPAIEMLHQTPPRMGVQDGELRMPLRTIRQAVLALVATAVLSAAAIASQPIRELLDGGEMTGPVTATLVFALVIVGLAAFALNSVRSLFDFSNLSLPQIASHATATDTAQQADAPPPLSWRSIVRQPGVTEALLSGIGFGLFFVFIYRAGEAAGQWPLVSARFVSVLMFGLVALATTTALLPERGSRRAVVLAGLLDAAAAVCFVISARTGLLSVGAVLAALYPVVTVVLARVITKERIRRQQMTGLMLALFAVGLLAV